MIANTLPEQEGSDTDGSTVEKRARFERFSMTVCVNGVVNVRNDSYGEDSGSHIYTVNPSEGSCTCPHHVHRGVRCKHLTAVESRPIVVSAAEAASETYRRVATDGGETKQESDETDDRFRLPEDPKHIPEDEVDEDDSHSERTVVDAYADRVEERKKVDDEPL